MKFEKKLQQVLRKTLKNDICSAQCLDVAEDRKRVEKEILKALESFFTWNLDGYQR